MLLKIISVILLSIASGILFRMGGAKGYDTLYRDLGCPLALVASLYILGVGVSWWAYLLTYALAYGSMTTYFKWASAWYTKDWRENVYLPSWVFTGFIYGICVFPLLFVGVDVKDFVLRVVLVTILIALVRELSDNVVVEEFGSGFILVASTLLFL